jgi:HSP20 family protein
MAQRMFPTFYPARGQASVRRGVWCPPLDVFETEDQIVLWLEVGGISAGEFDVKVEGPAISVSGRRHRPSDPSLRPHHIEIDRGEFYREVRLSYAPDADAVSASYRDGILEIRIPKPEPPVRITVWSE